MTIKEISATTFPSTLVYAVDVPEVKNFKANFVYNFFVTDEVKNDSGVLSEDAIDLMNVTNTIVGKIESGATLEGTELRKIPRYIKLTFDKPQAPGIDYGNIVGLGGNDTVQKFLSSLVFEDDFTQGDYSAINTDNKNITQITNSYLGDASTTQNIDKIQKNFDDSNPVVLDSIVAASSINIQAKNADFTKKLVNQYFDSLKKVKFSGQVSNSVIFDFFIATSDSIDPNKVFYKNHLDIAKAKQVQFKAKNFLVGDNHYKPSIKVYQDVAETVDSSIKKQDYRVTIIGYVIEKIELLDNGTSKAYDPIIIYSSNTSSYVDLKVRYGSVYAYKIRALYKIRYPAVVNDSSLEYKLVESIVASKPEVEYIETTENIAPPPPVELRFVWDYDRFNPTTAEFDASSGKPYPNTGTRGSLMIYWSFPNNSQLDIKKFQLFRRKSVDDPFELIKMIDFDDSVVKYPSPDQTINPKLIQRSVIDRKNKSPIAVPIMNYFDDDFLKTSEYIYSVASIDAHGLVSTYSEQFKVKFDSINNKLITELVSIAGAPKQYPNMYLQQDLFLDSIKIANKRNLHVYLNPECYSVKKNDESSVTILNSSQNGAEYVINFINTDKGAGRRVDINLDKKS